MRNWYRISTMLGDIHLDLASVVRAEEMAGTNRPLAMIPGHVALLTMVANGGESTFSVDERYWPGIREALEIKDKP